MCVNCNDSLQVNLPVAPSGLNGTNGQSAYVYIATANTNTGTGFTYPMNPTQPYIAIITTTTPIVNPVAGDFTGQWHYWVGPSGAAGTNGTNGTNGADGVNGAISLNYKWNNDTSASAPAASYVKVNNANVGLATSLYINITDANSSVVGNVLAYMVSSTNPTKSIVTITAKGDPTTFAHFAVTGGTLLSGTYYIASISPLSASSTAPFTLNDDVIFSFSIVGNKGADGTGGTVGPAGPTGAQGPIGPTGATGPAGPSEGLFELFITGIAFDLFNIQEKQ